MMDTTYEFSQPTDLISWNMERERIICYLTANAHSSKEGMSVIKGDSEISTSLPSLFQNGAWPQVQGM